LKEFVIQKMPQEEEISSESECDWEEVPETQAPKEVQLEFESAAQRKQRIAEEKERQCVEREIRRELNRIEQEKQILMHKGELTWFLLSFNRVNMAICNDEVLQSLLLSTLDLKRITTCKTTNSLIKLLEYVSKKLKVISCLETSPDSNDVYFQRYQKWKLVFDIIRGKKQIQTYFDLALLYTIAVRSVGIRCRLVCSFQPVTFKFATAKKIAISKAVANKIIKIPQFDGADDISDELVSNKKPRTRRTTKRKLINKSPAEKLSKKEFAREERQIRDILLSLPIPSSISDFKNHQLFFLRRHLLKYEAIYPEDTKPLSFIRGEAILPRTSVHVLMSRDKWIQQGQQVKDGEKPYKMVASAIINKKLGKSSDYLSLPLFGKWQTEKYKPPIATNGIVPRNNHNNVDLFQPEMIPVGCVHIKHLSNLKRVARKLNIDCVEAVIGFDSHSGKSHPVTEGYVVCVEFEEVLRQACREDSINHALQQKKKRRQRAVANWKLLFRAWRAKRKVERKYVMKKNTISGVSIDEEDNIESTQTWQADKLKSQKQKEGKKIGSRCRAKKQPKSKIKVPLPFTE